MKTAAILRLASVALLLPAVPISAQQHEVGLVMGGSFATFGGDIEGLDHQHGLALGLRLGAGIHKHVQVESGLIWIQKGAEGVVVGFEEPLRAAHELSYLEIPLLVRGLLPLGGAIRPTALFGASVAFEVGCEVAVEPVSSFLSPLDCHPQSGRKTTDWSLIMGGGATWQLSGVSLLLEGRYHVGLKDLRGPHSTFAVRNRAFAVVAGISVPLGASR